MRIDFLEAIRLLQSDQVIAIPTETVYGLAAAIQSKEAIESIFAIKKRPQNNPLIVHVGSVEECTRRVVTLPPGFVELTAKFWPGPLTIVLPIQQGAVCSLATAGLHTAAFRMPAHPLALRLARDIGPFVAPSANISGKPSATRAEHVERDFGMHFPVLDAGPSDLGLESTVVAYIQEKWQVVRLGALPIEALTTVLGYRPACPSHAHTKPLCPGQMYRHYAPEATLHLGVSDGHMDVVIGFLDRAYNSSRCIPWNVQASSTGDNPEEIARDLFHTLRLLDEEGVKEVWIDMAFPDEGLWVTIRERLERAAR